MGLARYAHYYSLAYLPALFTQLFAAQLYFPRAACLVAFACLWVRQQHIRRCWSDSLRDWESIEETELLLGSLVQGVLRLLAVSSALWLIVGRYAWAQQALERVWRWRVVRRILARSGGG